MTKLHGKSMIEFGTQYFDKIWEKDKENYLLKYTSDTKQLENQNQQDHSTHRFTLSLTETP